MRKQKKSDRIFSLFLVALLATTMFVIGCDRDDAPTQDNNGIISASDTLDVSTVPMAALLIGNYVVGDVIDFGWKVVTNIPVNINTAFLIKVGDTDKVTVGVVKKGYSESAVYPFPTEAAVSLLPYEGLLKVLPLTTLDGVDEVTELYNLGLGEYEIIPGSNSSVTDPDPAPATTE